MIKISLLQTDIVWADPLANIRQADALLKAHAGSDVYVLPEMWATGFATEPEGIAEPESASQALRWMREAAVGHHCAVCGSLAVQTADGTFRNRHYFCTPDGVAHYDKHHLFSYGHEDRYYTAGQERTLVEWCGCRFLLLTCYDLRFPVWSRNQGDFDAIIYIASWPDARIKAWDILLRARAIENQCFVIAANRIGTDDKNLYPGHSVVLDAKGDEISRYYAENQQIMTADVDKDALFAFRNKFRVLDDGDSFIIT